MSDHLSIRMYGEDTDIYTRTSGSQIMDGNAENS